MDKVQVKRYRKPTINGCFWDIELHAYQCCYVISKLHMTHNAKIMERSIRLMTKKQYANYLESNNKYFEETTERDFNKSGEIDRMLWDFR